MKQMSLLPNATANKISTKVLSPSMKDMKREMKKALRAGIKTYGAEKPQRLKGQASIANDVVVKGKKRPSKLIFRSAVHLKKESGGGMSDNQAKGKAIRGYALRKGTKKRKTKMSLGNVLSPRSRNRGRIVVKGDYFLDTWLPKKPTEELKAWKVLNEEVSKIK